MGRALRPAVTAGRRDGTCRRPAIRPQAPVAPMHAGAGEGGRVRTSSDDIYICLCVRKGVRSSHDGASGGIAGVWFGAEGRLLSTRAEVPAYPVGGRDIRVIDQPLAAPLGKRHGHAVALADQARRRLRPSSPLTLVAAHRGEVRYEACLWRCGHIFAALVARRLSTAPSSCTMAGIPRASD